MAHTVDQDKPSLPQTPINLGDLPAELTLQIGQYLDTRSLLRFARSCHSLYSVFDQEITHRAQVVYLAPLHQYEENFIFDKDQRPGIDEPVFSLHASYGVPAGEFGATDAEVLGMAVEKGELDIARGLLGRNVDPNAYVVSGERLLSLAVQSRRVDMVKLLLEYGADASRLDLVTETSPLVHAARVKDDEIVRILISASADVNADGVMPTLAFYCSVETVRMAVEYGGDLACVSVSGKTVLHSVVAREDARLFAWVVDQIPPCVLNARNDLDQTALHVALGDEARVLSPFAMLLACHAAMNVDVQDMWGYTALHLAVRTGRFVVAKSLIERGADLNILSMHGESALHLATASKLVSIARLLLARGAVRFSAAPADSLILDWVDGSEETSLSSRRSSWSEHTEIDWEEDLAQTAIGSCWRGSGHVRTHL
ncbi:Ankyrin-3 [Penicillium ucsense]|uniref:Ankyrin-3 n=1 Tax=Penicillium ucsense TaxID=2839758 RepID=A0A8J8WAZ7_9EURO|nr:Ankyrin-3 [Penicillium ucsense]KAF7737564.1 Ankyrin-3 [Penicillium ucsense]